MKRQPIEVNGEFFATKSALTNRVRGILYAHVPEHRIESPDLEFLTALLNRHPKAILKIGSGIHCIFVRVNRAFGDQRGFWLQRLDGSETDWSFIECITPSDQRKKFASAARAAIAYQVIAFKRRESQHLNSFCCPVTGEHVSIEEAHVDHREPWTFEAILDAFIREFSIDVQGFSIESDGDGQLSDRFTDRDMEMEWRKFHAEKAGLRLVSQRANLSVLRTRSNV